MFNPKNLSWNNSQFPTEIDGDKVKITTLAKTDLWQKTFGDFESDNAPAFQMPVEDQYFSFTVKCSFEPKARFDQCGIIMYMNSDTWLKASMECEDDDVRYLGSVSTNFGYSDWATTEVTGGLTTMWYRLKRREKDFMLESSEDGKNFHVMRMFHMFNIEEKINLGIYACSPGESSFTATFSDFNFEVLKKEDMTM